MERQKTEDLPMNFKRIFSIPCCIGLLFSSANALPTAKEVFAKMGMGYNIGNTLEVPMNPSAWGNDFPTQELIDSVKSAGFNTVRIPCAWYSHSNAIAVDSNWTLYTPDGDENTINAAWLDSVKTVVDYVVKRDMYAILNIHWDNGWLEDHIGTSVDEKINARQKSYWEQIAAKFKDYDEHLLFASTNEPGESGDGLKQDNANTLKAYHETMIKAVRSSGGNNATRTIIVQAPDTDENKAHNYLKGNFPADPAGTDYMMGEFHFYPYTFALMEQDADWGNTVRYWGEGNYSTTDAAHNVKKGAYASPEYVDSVFAMLGEDFKDIPMVIGEFGVIKRLELKGEDLRLHLKSRADYYGRIAELSKKYGFVPCIWDTGDEGNGNMTIIRRNKNRGILDYESLNAMRAAYGLPKFKGNSIDALVEKSLDNSDREMKVIYKAQSDTAETGTLSYGFAAQDWSQYTAMSFDIKFKGSSSSWSGVTLFNMSADWKWKQVSLGDFDDFTGEWQNIKIAFDGSSEPGMDFEDISKVVVIGINVQGVDVDASLELDNIILWKEDGTKVTFLDFNDNKELKCEGIAVGGLAPSTINDGETRITTPANTDFTRVGLRSIDIQQGLINAIFIGNEPGSAKAFLINGLGQMIATQNINAKAGSNSIQLKAETRGPAILMIKQGSQVYSQKVILK